MYRYAANNPVKYTDPDGRTDRNPKEDFVGVITIYSSVGDNKVFSEKSSGWLNYGNHSWLSYTDHKTGETHFYGTWGVGDLGLREDTIFEVAYDQYYKNVSQRSIEITEPQKNMLMVLIQQAKDKGEDAWSYFSPCSYWAADTWNKVTGENLKDRHSLLFYSDPNILAKSIKEANEKDNKTVVKISEDEKNEK